MENPDRQEQIRAQETTNNDISPSTTTTPTTTHHNRSFKHRLKTTYTDTLSSLTKKHKRTPYLRRIPLRALLIITILILINLTTWAICALILTNHTHLLSTAALAYSLGLRHALDADHISAIDLMTRRLIASGQRPVTVGTFFSLGHSTIVIITSIVVAATAAGITDRFGGFGKIGGIIGSSVSAAFLILLGIMNAYILWKLLGQLRKVVHLQPEEEVGEAFRIEGGGVLFRVLKRLFRLIDRPWKMYPLGVLFGLGFDTSSEVALLGISSIQGANGTSIWLILIFPVLFTVGMCLVDTVDGALMMGLYVAPLGAKGDLKNREEEHEVNLALSESRGVTVPARDEEDATSETARRTEPASQRTHNLRIKSPLTFLYYSSVLTLLTVMVALVIGTIQLLSLILNVAISDEEAEKSSFWQGVATAGDYYDVIGGAICGAFIIFGLVSVACYRPWRRWVDDVRSRERELGGRGTVELVDDGRSYNNEAGPNERSAARVVDEGEVTGLGGVGSSRHPQAANREGAVRFQKSGVRIQSGQSDEDILER